MKTLDEVIEMAERCTLPYPGDCLNCEYFDEDDNDCRCKILADALHYLKEFQGLSKMWNDKLDKEQENNPPITWNELQQMEGKPVWVEFFYEDGQHCDSDWFLVGFVSESFCDVIGKLGTSRLVKNDYWQAYRKER